MTAGRCHTLWGRVFSLHLTLPGNTRIDQPRSKSFRLIPDPVKVIIKINHHRTGQLAQQIKAFAAKTDNLRSTPGLYMVEGKN